MMVIVYMIVVCVKCIDECKCIVYGEVYVFYQFDIYGEFMILEDIELMVYWFMCFDLSWVIDIDYDNVVNGFYLVESFMVCKGDVDFIEDVWVLGVKILEDVVWECVLVGDLNGFLFQLMVWFVEVDVIV